MNARRNLILTVALIFLFFIGLVYSPSAFSQVPDPGIAAQAPVAGSGHNYIGIGAETVNPADGSLTFDLPIQTPTGRGVSIPFGIRFSSNEQYYPSNQCVGGGCNSGSQMFWHTYWDFGYSGYQVGPWSYDLPVLTWQTSVFWQAYIPDNGCPNGDCQFQLNLCWGNDSFVFRGLDGSQHSLPIADVFPDAKNSESGYCPTSPSNVKSPGNNHGMFSILGSSSATVIDPSGTTYLFNGVTGAEPQSPGYTPSNMGSLATSITDRNGNEIVLSGNSYKDATGRTAIAWTGIGNDGDQITISGLSKPITVHWTTATATFPESYANVSGESCTLENSYASNTGSGTTASFPVISEVDLPNGQKYTFQYDGTYGKVSKITFPDGGYVSYSWGLDPLSQFASASWIIPPPAGGSPTSETCWIHYDVPAITDRYVSFDGQTQVLHQHFAYQPTQWNGNQWTSKQTIVTTTDEVTQQTSTTTYTYKPSSPDSPVYAGSAYATQVPVETNVVYQDANDKTWKTLNKIWLNPQVMAGEQTILDNGQGSAVLRCYDANEQITNIYEYGYQSEGAYPGDPGCVSSSGLTTSAIGSLQRQTTTVYQPFFSWSGGLNSGTYTGTHIVNAPESVTIANGSNATAKQSLYYYDQNPLVSSGAINLANPGATRGNITTLKRLTSGSSYATTTYQYYDTGQVYTVTDPCGNATCSDMSGANHTATYYYSDNYASGTGTPTGQTFAYLTQVTNPLGQVDKFSWGFNDGLIRSHTDQNNQTTSYQYSDPLARLTEIDGPPDPSNGNNHSTTQVCYNDSTPNTSITVSVLLNTGSGTASCRGASGTWKNSVTVRDGMGHTVQAQLTSDPSGTDYVNTLYTGLGNVYEQSNPTRCSSAPGTLPGSCGESSWGYTTFSYDILGRKTQLVRSPDGSSQSWAYTGPTVSFTDEKGNQWQRTSDAFGNLLKVLEPNGSTQSASMETDYTYDTLNDLLTVTQQGDGSGNRDRSFAYDDLGHLLAAMNPETSGSINSPSVSYTVPPRLTCAGASGSTWSTCYTYDANGNLNTKEDNRQITIGFTYDDLNRVTQKSYNDGTQSERFGYDGKDENGNPISGLTNSIGHLSHSSNEVDAASTYSYSVMGRPISKTSCVPGDCSYDISVQNGYDLGGDVTSLTNGSPHQPITLTYGYNGAEQLQSLTSSWAPDCNRPATLFSAAAYGPVGLTNATLGGVNSGCQAATTNLITETRSYDSRARVSGGSFAGSAIVTSAPSGTITISGSEQSTQINLTAGSGTVTINGSEQSKTIEVGCGPYGQMCPETIYDGGNIQVTVNGHSENVSYNSSSSKSTIASALVSAFNNDSGSPVSASAPQGSNVVTLEAKTTGAGTNYSLSATVTAWNSSNFSSPSFSPAPSGSTLTGGTNGTTSYDTGTITATVNGVNASASWGQGDTPSSIATKLSSSIQSAMGSFLSASANNGVVTLISNSLQYWSISSSASNTNSNFSSASFSAQPAGMNPAGHNNETAYSYTVGYDLANNVTSLNDSVIGDWKYNVPNASGNAGYDTLNRLVAGQATSGPYSGQYVCWTYDGFGNRTMESVSSTACNNNPAPTSWAHYNASNQVTGTSLMASGYNYDAAGDVTDDGRNLYLYDGAGRICAVKNLISGQLTGYIYDAEGNRVAKGTLSSWPSACPAHSQIAVNTEYINGMGGEQLSEQTVSGGTTSWSHTNVFAGAPLVATYSGTDTYFNLADWQGTKRAESSADGCLTGWLSLPYGDNPQSDPTAVAIGSARQCGVDATEHHFTGKVHDSESGNDDFGARYYADTAGRWLSPDWAAAAEAVPYATFDDPQSLNLYSFVGNNPLDREDADGHCNSATAENKSDKCEDAQRADTNSTEKNSNAQNTVTVEYLKGQNGNPLGHAAISVGGKQAVGLEQKKDSVAAAVEDKTTPGAVKAVDPKREVKDKATIQLTPDQATKIQTFLDNAAKSPPNYNLFHSNCAQFCESALKAGGVKNVPNDRSPRGLVNDLNGSPNMMDYIRMVPIPPIL